MPRIDDHPLVLARLKANVSRSELGRKIGVNRTTLAAIEEGRTQTPSEATLLQIDRVLFLQPGTLLQRIEVWKRERRNMLPGMPLQARALLSQPASDVHKFSSFRQWRQVFAPTPNAFASMLGINHSTVTRYESGIRYKSFPDSLATALLTVFGISTDYLLELRKLPPSDD